MIFEFFTRDFPGKKIKWKKFLKGFLWKIEAGRKILKGYPLFHTRASLARAAFKRDFLDNHGARRSIAFKTFFDSRYRPPTPVLVSEVKKSEVK